MYKIFLSLILGTLLSAELINGVSVVVKGEVITLYDIKEEMRKTNASANIATDILIRKKLEVAEINERKISVSNSDVYDEIKKTASLNKMDINEFYEVVRNSSGLNSAEFKEKTKERLLSQKLYAAIAYSSMEPSSDDETKEYYELHKAEFLHPSAFKVVIYTSRNKEALEKKITNPIFYSLDIKKDEQTLPYDKISPELAELLEKTAPNSFTSIFSEGKGFYTTFYLKQTYSNEKTDYNSLKEQITNLLMAQKREQVLSDYFARLRNNADIQIIRDAQ
ncbi:MAG: peptidylprolyl isomerase [Sulfurimonas sp. RIFOXYD12_FULL_33_39]|uniref:peptidylprolyl isomerase n=1 Tax=unclassified Sulfurimonas TaxID=2623549 RepID=UPI0008B27E16|nr:MULTISPECIES: SurA N-terminal domain-containing protein [unclassified Sulfurimonas]OHE07695.1 MAG: peptidylprolyl isomerase [Sulfurimonas sp. RIFCSPLOWO2_12_FULL_34_6]OHE10741.1 MAG: peptidylprolyl isomerase [Sulfurimonas sp. RIFOXYD12_FULL_33_39]OHE13489.1 MAG: peptidylprolyl isomerase [Sulfurimonas sp. RIFOXYD2_FULL_34_21]